MATACHAHAPTPSARRQGGGGDPGRASRSRASVEKTARRKIEDSPPRCRMTTEQRLAFKTFRAVVVPLRLRVKVDAEGFPIAAGRYGQLEWHDAGHLAIHSRTLRMLAKLTGIPGVRRHQVGDHE